MYAKVLTPVKVTQYARMQKMRDVRTAATVCDATMTGVVGMKPDTKSKSGQSGKPHFLLGCCFRLFCVTWNPLGTRLAPGDLTEAVADFIIHQSNTNQFSSTMAQSWWYCRVQMAAGDGSWYRLCRIFLSQKKGSGKMEWNAHIHIGMRDGRVFIML